MTIPRDVQICRCNRRPAVPPQPTAGTSPGHRPFQIEGQGKGAIDGVRSDRGSEPSPAGGKVEHCQGHPRRARWNLDEPRHGSPHRRHTPSYRPGAGLRPQKPEHATARPGRVPLEVLEDAVPTLCATLCESIAAHSRLGLNAVADVCHHDFHTQPRNILTCCSGRLRGLSVLFVGVGCSIDVTWERREQTWGQVCAELDGGVVAAVELCQYAAREHNYDLEVDTSRLSPGECAAEIRKRLDAGPPGVAFHELGSG